MKSSIIAGALVAVVAVLYVPDTALAIDLFTQCADNGEFAVCEASKETAAPLVSNVIDVLLLTLSFVAVIMIIIGGIRYAVSNGDAARIKSAKDTILYSVVGLVVAILSYAIVRFIVDQF